MERKPSKKVYVINNRSFVSDSGTKNGKEKCQNYAYENCLNANDMIIFDSETEFKRYLYLLRQVDLGIITNLQRQYTFRLIPEFTTSAGKKHETMTYVADFVYKKDNLVIVEDVKGYAEEVFLVKWKLFDYIYLKKNICLLVIKRCGKRGENCLDDDFWCEYDNFSRKGLSLKAKQKELIDTRNKINKLEKEKIKRDKEIALLKKYESLEKPTKSQKNRIAEIKEKYGI